MKRGIGVIRVYNFIRCKKKIENGKL